jgi:methionine-rich copper-binding protein CopC
MTKGGIRRALALVCITVTMLGAAMLAVPSPAWAHDNIVGSNPKNGASVATLPSAVLLTFEEPPVAGYTKVRVTGPSGALVSKGAPVSTGSRVTIALAPSKAAGTYAVHWSLLSDDGHPLAGVVRFTVTATVTGRRTALSPVAKSATAKKGGAGAAWVGVTLGTIALLVVVFGIGRLCTGATRR